MSKTHYFVGYFWLIAGIVASFTGGAPVYVIGFIILSTLAFSRSEIAELRDEVKKSKGVKK